MQYFAVEIKSPQAWVAVNLLKAPGGGAAVRYHEQLCEDCYGDLVEAADYRVRPIHFTQCWNVVQDILERNPELRESVKERLSRLASVRAGCAALIDPLAHQQSE